MIEKFIPGRELTVGILGDRALPVGEIKPVHEIYDYECKYTAGMAVEEFPAALSAEQTSRVQQQALAAFRSLKLRGYARIDFRLAESDDGEGERRVLLSRGEHVAGDDRAQPHSAGRGSGGNNISRPV